MLSCANLVLTEGRTLLNAVEFEQLIILLMNHEFITYMREHYAAVVASQFGRTLVEESAGGGVEEL